jgi:hypothetical protein
MKSFSSYIKSLLPSFETSRLKSLLNSMCEEIQEILIPTIEKLLPIFPANWKWRNNDVKTFMTRIQTTVKLKKVPGNANAIVIINAVLANMLVTLPFMRGEVDKAFGREVAADGLTYSKTTMLQYGELADFFVRYTQVLINYVTSAELNAINGSQKVSGIGPDDLDYLRVNMPTYLVALRVLAIDVNQLKSDMRSIPDMVIDESTESGAIALIGSHKADPLGFASLPFPLSTIYRIRLGWAESQISKYEALVAESKAVEYRILLMTQRIEEGHGDAATERLLEVHEERLEKMRYKIAKLEQEYDL